MSGVHWIAQVLRARLLAAISETEELENVAGEGVGVGVRYRPDYVFAPENLGSGLHFAVAVLSLRSSEYGSCQCVTLDLGNCRLQGTLCTG